MFGHHKVLKNGIQPYIHQELTPKARLLMQVLKKVSWLCNAGQ